jgi:hypothetical protein
MVNFLLFMYVTIIYTCTDIYTILSQKTVAE